MMADSGVVADPQRNTSPTNGDNNNTPPSEDVWDKFQTAPVTEEGRANNAYAWLTVQRMCKVLLYGFLFLAVLGGLMVSRWALIVMTGNVGKYQQLMSADSNSSEPALSPASAKLHRDGWVFLLLFGVISPYVWTFLVGLVNMKCSKQSLPSVGGFLCMVLMETMHSSGLSVFLWKVLPVLNIVEASLTFCVVGVFPSILCIFHVKKSGCRAWEVTFSIMATLIQLAGFFLSMEQLCREDGICWEAPVSVLLLSVHYTKNYVRISLSKDQKSWIDERLSNVCARKTCKCPRTCECRRECRCPRKCRCTCTCTCTSTIEDSKLYLQNYLFPSAVKIGLTFGFAFALVRDLSSPYIVLTSLAEQDPGWRMAALYVFIPLILAPVLTFFFSCKASQLLMQRLCYALPVTLHTPVLTTLCILYAAGLVPQWIQTVLFLSPPTQPLWFSSRIKIGLGMCWLSQVWISRHLWFPTNVILERIQNLFVAPIYCCVHLEQFLAFCRTITDKEIQLPSNEGKTSDMEMQSTEYEGRQRAVPSKETPMIYVCATLYQESKTELLQMLKSIFRLDEDHAKIRNYNELIKKCKGKEGDLHEDGYNFEVHIMFDNVLGDGEKTPRWILNEYVVTFLETINEAVSCLEYQPITLQPPDKIYTPYGGQLIYTLPGGNRLFVHLKDKWKIRNKKRWSQIMYMYYLLGYKNLAGVQVTEYKEYLCNEHQPVVEIFQKLPEDAVNKSKNTYLLTLDGDVDWEVADLQMLVHRLQKDENVGVACGRIHPIGSGPMVWYQKFEYAIGHWLQKAAEHVLGCVLCAPGCFALFRGSAIMDDNVMKTYSTEAKEARHHVQYDQGEDRWLSTLLLQRGYRVEYVAASDAYTYAPDTFQEFFKQRRRWAPSTMANILDLLGSWPQVVKRNNTISHLYMAYQLLIFVSSVLGPATIVLLIADVFNEIWQVGAGWSLVLSLIPVVFYMVVCFTSKSDTQIAVAGILSGLYSIMMISVIVGSIMTIADSILTPTELFLILIGGMFIISALLHPRELSSLVHGVLYYITIPSGYLVLIIFIMINMNELSWGTRESSSESDKDKGKNKSVLSELGMFLRQCCGNNRQQRKEDSDAETTERQADKKEEPGQTTQQQSEGSVEEDIEIDWMKTKHLRESNLETLDDKEEEFWKELIKRYLTPSKKMSKEDEKKEEAKKEAKKEASLKELRNNACLGFFMLNALWIAINFFMQRKLSPLECLEDLKLFHWKICYKKLHLVFLAIFGVVLTIQFVAMLAHRLATFGHIMGATKLKNRTGYKRDAMALVCDIMRQKPATEVPHGSRDGADSTDESSSLLKRFDSTLSTLRNGADDTISCQCLRDRVRKLEDSVASTACKCCTWHRKGQQYQDLGHRETVAEEV